MNIYRLWWDADFRNVPEQIEADSFRFINTLDDNTKNEGQMIEFVKGDDVVCTLIRYPQVITLVRST